MVDHFIYKEVKTFKNEPEKVVEMVTKGHPNVVSKNTDTDTSETIVMNDVSKMVIKIERYDEDTSEKNGYPNTIVNDYLNHYPRI